MPPAMIDRLMGYVIINYGKTIRFRVILTSPFILNTPLPYTPLMKLECVFNNGNSNKIKITIYGFFPELAWV